MTGNVVQDFLLAVDAHDKWDELQAAHQGDALYFRFAYQCGNNHTFKMCFHEVMAYTNTDALPCGCGWPAGITMTEEQPE